MEGACSNTAHHPPWGFGLSESAAELTHSLKFAGDTERGSPGAGVWLTTETELGGQAVVPSPLCSYWANCRHRRNHSCNTFLEIGSSAVEDPALFLNLSPPIPQLTFLFLCGYTNLADTHKQSAQILQLCLHIPKEEVMLSFPSLRALE